jgi:hypothetical protein
MKKGIDIGLGIVIGSLFGTMLYIASGNPIWISIGPLFRIMFALLYRKQDNQS